MHPTMCFTVAVLGRCKDKLTQRSTTQLNFTMLCTSDLRTLASLGVI